MSYSRTFDCKEQVKVKLKLFGADLTLITLVHLWNIMSVRIIKNDL